MTFAALTVLFTLGAAWVPGPQGIVAGSAVLAAGALAAGWVLLRFDGWSSGAAGLFADRRAFGEAGAGILLGASIAGVSLAAMAVAGGVRWVADGDPWSVLAWARGAIASLAWFAVPAAAEEVLLRGYLFAAAARVWGPMAALWGTSVGFGLLHGANPGVGMLGLLGVTAAGLWLGALVLRSGSIWPAIGAHLGWNWGIGYVGDVPVSGLEVADAPGYDGRPDGAEWLSGGGFGVEASLLAVAALGVAAWVTWRWAGGRTPESRPMPMWRAGTVVRQTVQ